MTPDSLTVVLPESYSADWIDDFRQHLQTQLALLADRWSLQPPILKLRTEGLKPTVVVKDTVFVLNDQPSPLILATCVCYKLNEHPWETLHAPALAACGRRHPDSFWLRQAASRGLTFPELTALADVGFDEERIAWRLADRHPPQLTIRTNPGIASPFTKEEIRPQAATAANQTGLPIPIPSEPTDDLSVPKGHVVLAIGIRWLPLQTADTHDSSQATEALKTNLLQVAGCCVDPGLVLALCTDPERVGKRLAVRAMAGHTPVRIAERLFEEHQRLIQEQRRQMRPIDLYTVFSEVVERAATAPYTQPHA